MIMIIHIIQIIIILSNMYIYIYIYTYNNNDIIIIIMIMLIIIIIILIIILIPSNVPIVLPPSLADTPILGGLRAAGSCRFTRTVSFHNFMFVFAD